MLRLTLVLATLTAGCLAFADEEPGHSHQGSAFDSGMRTRPWIIKGVGVEPFPITAANPEVQKWFDQGNALLASFWFEEAERSFRWCLKLDPNCAMAYWGLARCGFTWFVRFNGPFDEAQFGRYKAFLAQAVKREGSVTPRERAYIEAWAEGYGDNVPNRARRLVDLLQALAAKYPDDIEAKALLGLYGIDVLPAKQNQAVLDQVLARNPMHPGALHATIHNWDDSDPVKALAACRLYGHAAPGVGHALHMPGHIYSKVGMWHEAAISMDSATRTELKYMNQRLALPYEDWDYAHNRNYLSYIQEQLGMEQASLQGARDLLAAPRDRDVRGYDFRAEHEGFKALLRGLIKFERWDEILKPGGVPWDDGDDGDRAQRPLDEVLALVGSGRAAEARTKLNELLQEHAKDADHGSGMRSQLMFQVAEAEVRLAEGDGKGGLDELRTAAASDDYGGDPPNQPWPVTRLVGDAELRAGDARAAIVAYTAALAREPNDGFSLAGLAQACAKAGDTKGAETYADRLVYEWADADPGLKWLAEVKALGLGHKSLAVTPGSERRYDPAALRGFGPSNWAPFPAPKLAVTDLKGRPVSLTRYRGKNVVLVFYLGASCVHCVQQLELINQRMSEFERRDTVVLAACSAPATPAPGAPTLGDVRMTLLTDHDHESARRFASYDDFEGIELHSTILIDRNGDVRWKRTGGDPFTNIDFLLSQIDHVNRVDRGVASVSEPAAGRAG